LTDGLADAWQISQLAALCHEIAHALVEGLDRLSRPAISLQLEAICPLQRQNRSIPA